MRWFNPMDAAFAARVHDKSKFANRAYHVPAKKKFKQLSFDFENMKNVTPTKFNGCVNIEKVGHDK